jgi:hypothetical protein
MATSVPALIPDLIRRVTYSKYLLRRATSLQREANELATAEAVLVAHDGAEMLMRVVVDFLGAKVPDRFMLFWQNVTEKTSIQPPHKAAMDRLNDLRVGFKHKGNLPNRSVADNLLPVVTAFCYEIASLYLKLDYETVSLADFHDRSLSRGQGLSRRAWEERGYKFFLNPSSRVLASRPWFLFQ